MAEFLASYTGWIGFGLISLVMLIMLATAPCHAALLLPFVGIPLFWLLPLEYALPINIAAWLVSPLLYRAIRRAMRKPPADGFRSLVGTEAEVVSRSETGRTTKYLVRAGGELWTARCTSSLQPGEQVNIAAVDGISLVVESGDIDTAKMKENAGGIPEY